MKWYLVVFFCIIWAEVNGNNKECNQENYCKFGRYKKCMDKYGISSWKIVDSASNATYYNIFNYQWNQFFDTVFPIAIFIPSSVFDVQATVRCGFEAKIPIVPNSGSHSYAGLSLGTNSSIIVDFRYMNSIVINEKERSVTIGAGALVGHVNAKLWKNGGWGIPLGNCMTVALGGHVLGGGYSLYSTLYGLVIDNVLEMKMVDAQGRAVIVNPTKNTDLWWALRGIGPGYIGMVTSYKIKMFKAKDVKVTSVRIQYKIKDFQYVMERYYKFLDWVKQNEPSLASFLIAVNDNYKETVSGEIFNPGVEVRLVHIQDPNIQPNSSTTLLKEFPKMFPKSLKTIVNNVSYIEFVVATSFSPVILPSLDKQLNKTEPKPPSANETLAKFLEIWPQLSKKDALPHYAIQKSFFVNRRFGAKDLNNVQKVLSDIPNYTCAVVIRSEQGAISARRSTDSAYIHRDHIFNVRIQFEGLHVKDVAPGKAWMAKFMDASRFMDSGKTFPNFPDIELKDYLYRYYGSNLGKLILIKRKWDPKGYFKTKQSIPTFT